MTDVLVWLRATIEGDKATAQAAHGPNWNAEKRDVAYGDEWIMSALTQADAAHIVLHDPQNAIARCEAELLLLDEHRYEAGDCSSCGRESWEENPGGYLRNEPEMVDVWRPASWPCRTIRLLAYGYRHRDGYLEEWKP